MKKIIGFFVALLGLFVFVTPALAVSFNDNGISPEDPNIGYLYLVAKDPANWETLLPNQGWGKLEYNLTGPTFDYVFNGHKLDSSNKYTLIYYPDPWPGNGLICLGDGVVNKGGNIHIEGSVDNTGDLPAPYDANYPGGAKIWLVSSGDVNCGTKMMTGWNPNSYLFEYDKISFDDTNWVNLEDKSSESPFDFIYNNNIIGWATFSDENPSNVELWAQSLTPNRWYFIGVDEENLSCNWQSQINDGNSANFYSKTDSVGNLHISFTTSLDTYTELSVKNAVWANTGSGWIYQGGSWDYILYSVNTIPGYCSP